MRVPLQSDVPFSDVGVDDGFGYAFIFVLIEGAESPRRRLLGHHRGIRAANAAIYDLANSIQAGELRLSR